METKSIWRATEYRILIAGVLLTLLIGTLFYSWSERWGYLDAFYFSVITLTTIGYGDLTPTQPISKLFTTVYVFTGLSFLGVFINLLTKRRAGKIAKRAKERDSHKRPSSEVTAQTSSAATLDTSDESSAQQFSYLDELERLAALRDRDVITAEEFQAKKEQLLGL